MITLRKIEFEVDKPTQVLENLKWDLVIKSESATWYNFNFNNKPRLLGYFAKNNMRFLINGVLENRVFDRHSLICLNGRVEKPNKIIVNQDISFAGIIALIFHLLFLLLLFNIPTEDFLSKLFIVVMSFVVLINFYRYYKDIRKTDDLITKRIEVAEERTKSEEF